MCSCILFVEKTRQVPYVCNYHVARWCNTFQEGLRISFGETLLSLVSNDKQLTVRQPTVRSNKHSKQCGAPGDKRTSENENIVRTVGSTSA